MALRNRYTQNRETYLSFELAANARYIEGLSLMKAGYGAGGIYLMGYAAEMFLKSAYFRFKGAKSSDEMRFLLPPAVAAAKRFQLEPAKEDGYHDLNFWASLLRQQRRYEKQPLPHRIDQRLISGTQRLSENWYVSMRYQQDQAQEQEIKNVYDDVTWLKTSYNHLWR